MSPNEKKETVYFGYGSNLWLHQMDLRCPTSKYLGVARLNGYRWIINDRGYANVVEVNDPFTPGKTQNEKYSDVVFGLVYSLQPSDERRLDKNEGVPIAYTKELLPCDFWSSANGSWVDVSKKPSYTRDMLVYIDRNRTKEDQPKKEYVYRMNRGIEDAVKMGVPEGYVEKVMRRFIPKDGEVDGVDGGKREREKALRQATRFEDESGVFESVD